ncbi:hypothetical protein AWB70_07144 [Caballeronia cordobensis]|uniref:Glycosyltransferase RgtA/B/C/D-like domain-containing protein n=1 Tax=Caballeronia cordobensis TaxID=1353886 RepID=A0A158JNT8_CABCO|nr:hypothetical protein [Caballeronia cordobensis]SAL70448.1 hypothetical protein AWB70_07144 [Caballeronia cordobensis]
MFDRLMRTGPQLSRGVIAWLAGIASCGYIGLFVAGKSLLPAFLFRDAEKIQAQMNGSSTYDGSSFDAVGKLYAMFGPTLLNVFVMAVGIWFICALLTRVRDAGALSMALLLGVPCVFFNLFVASKDTLVVAMALMIVWTLRRGRAGFTTFVAIAAYMVYALLVRRYFLLIVVCAGGVWLFRCAGKRARFVLVCGVLLTLFLLPSVVYTALLHPRDMAVDYLMYQSPYGARTSFYNLIAPDTFLAFCIDYLYAALRLHLPVLFSPDPRGLAMQAFVIAAWCAARPMRRAAEACPGIGRLACLVMGHIIVSMLFEPDLGSYVRHLSSVSIFCMVLFATRANPVRAVRADNQRRTALSPR